MSLSAHLCCPTSENSVTAKFAVLVIAEVQLRRIYCQEGKRCMLVSTKPGADFSRGYALPARRPLISAPPPPPLDSPTALFQPCSKSNMEVYTRAFCFLVPHQPIGLCSYGREISKRLTMWHMKLIHVADVSTLAAH